MAVPRPINFAAALQRLRQAAGLSQQELAELAGLSVRGISALERGERRSPQPATVRQLATALGLTEPARSEFIAAARSTHRPNQAEPATPAAPSTVFDRDDTEWSPPPNPPTPLIGRRDAVVEIQALLSPSAGHLPRLVTLTGPGGIGKTRLAIAAAAALAPSFSDRVAWVELADLRDASLVAAAMMEAIGGQADPDRALVDVLAAHLGPRPALLVLDNVEHVLAAAADIATLLTKSPSLRILCTSRERLFVRAEQVVPVRSLAVPSLPEADQPATLAEVAATDAVRLFVDRARAADHDFQLTPNNAGDIAQICVQLQGMPLALELASAQMRVLTPAAVRDRLTNRLDTLSGGPRDLGQRQSSMSNAIAWSYDLLDPTLQMLLRRLSVFTGGFSLFAAEAFCWPVLETDGAERDGQSLAPDGQSATIAEGIGALILKSLVERDARPQRTGRFQLLEVIREFAFDRLVASGEADTMQHAHATYFLELAEELNRVDTAAINAGAAVAHLEADFPNVRAALTYYAATGESASLLRLAAALDWFWPSPQHLQEGVAWLEQALAAAVPLPANRSKALMSLGLLRFYMGQDEHTMTLYADALSQAAAAGDPNLTALAISSLGALAIYQEDFERGADLSDQALQLSASLRDPEVGAWLGATARSNLGWAAHQLGDTTVARDHLATAISQLRAMNHEMGLMRSLQYAAGIAHDSGDHETAAQAYRESLDLAARLDDERRLAAALDGLATIAVLRGHPESATRLFGAAERLRELLGGARAARPIDRAAHERGVAACRNALGLIAFDRAWTAGRTLSRDAAIAEAHVVAAAGAEPRQSWSNRDD